MTPEQIEKLEEQAYARIIWGEGKKEVVQSLIGEGVLRDEAERIVKESLKDRAAEIRKEGVRNVLWGTLLFFLVKGGFRLLLGKESGSISGMD